MTEKRGHILLVDDDAVFAKVFGNELSRMNFSVSHGFGKDILDLLSKKRVDIVILDMVMPGVSGLELLIQIKKAQPGMDVIMLTGNATVENAITSMKEGAYDYFTKPVELDRVEQVLIRCLEKRRLSSENQMLKNRLSDLREGQLIGKSPAINEIKSLISRFAEADSTVLIHGESGTGKELIANLIHAHSARRNEPFIIVDCTALKESLLESELFGHERGAFTGAVAKKHGIFEVADGGSIFLDEIGDIAPPLQAKLLRVVETKSFRRVGSNDRIVVDVRIIAATNRDLLDMVKKDEFREDLYYRLNVINISVPPLREHPEDIPLLADRLLKELELTTGKARHFSEDALDVLKGHTWPGNVRELKNVVERAVLLSDTSCIEPADMPLKSSPLQTVLNKYAGKDFPPLHEIENAYIIWILEKTKGNKQLAAKILGIDRKTITRRTRRSDSEE